MEIEAGFPTIADYHDDHFTAADISDELASRQLELEELAAEARSKFNDALSAVNQLIDPFQPRKKVVLGFPFHPRTGKIRMPRDKDVTDHGIHDEQEERSDDDCPISELALEVEQLNASTQPFKPPPARRGRPASVKSNPADIQWVSSSPGKYGVNKPKCPPCARLKKKDPCNGQAPCRQCWGKGRRTPEECQEWGENYIPKVRKRRGPKPGHKLAKKAALAEEQ